MADQSPMIEQLDDEDLFLVFRLPDGHPRRKTYRVKWSVAKKIIQSLQPTVQGPQGAPGKDGAPGRDGFNGKDGLQGLPGKDGAPGKDGINGTNGKDGAQGPAGAPKRIERYTGIVAGSQGIATVNFPEFAAPPLGQVVTTWDGTQMVTGQVTATTKTTATVKVMKSVGVLLVNASPFGVAPAGQVVTIDVFGN